MAPNLTSGTFKIVSLVSDDHPPTGISYIIPAWQQVVLNGPITAWKIKQDGPEAPESYRLSIGGYGFTTIIGDNVNATVYGEQNIEWHATYRKHQDAYTIEPVDDRYKGWTVEKEESPDRDVIKIEVIRTTRSFPPQFVPSQLFRFVPVHEDEAGAEATPV